MTRKKPFTLPALMSGVAAMILYNPFVDFHEPTHPRQLEEECLHLGRDPGDFREAMHTISAVENLCVWGQAVNSE